jgi:hypothetical protein
LGNLLSEKIISEERFQRLPFAEESASPDLLYLLIPFSFLHSVAPLPLCVLCVLCASVVNKITQL